MTAARPVARGLAAATLAASLVLGCRGGDRTPPAADGALSAAGQAAFAVDDSLVLAGNTAAALELMRAQAERAEREDASIAEQAESFMRLGSHEMDLGDLDGARPHLNRAVELATRAGATHRLLEAEARNTWGTWAKNQGLYVDAQHSHEAAAAIARSLGDSGRVELAAAHAGVGAIMRISPARRDSTALLQGEAIALLREVKGDSSLQVARMRVGYAMVLAQLDRIPEAREALALGRPVLASHLGPDHPQRALAASISGWVGLRTGDLVSARRDLEQSLETYARLRLGAKAGRDRLRYRPKGADVLAAVHLAAGRPEEAWNVLDAAQSLLFNEAMNDGGTTRDTPRSITVPPHSRQAIQATLDPETAIMGWLDVSQVDEAPLESWVYVLRDRGPVKWIRLDSIPPRDPGEFGRLRAKFTAAVEWPARLAPSPALDASAQLAWRQRFAAAERELAGVRNLVLVLSPGFGLLPVDALIDANGMPLVSRYAVSYIHSPSTRVDLARRAAAAPRAATPHAVFIDGDLLTRDDEDGRIGQLAKFASTTHLRPGRAAEGAVREAWAKEERQAPPQLVQFDGHALNDALLPGRAALVLDGAGSGVRALEAASKSDSAFIDRPDDGLLSVSEIEQLRIPADLVVLAACQSAGGYTYGGFVGIGDAFLHAGANSVLTSLWPVDERATVEVLRRFCAHAYGPGGAPRLPLPEALRRAREEVRTFVAADGTRPYAHPAYWSPFVLVGVGDTSAQR
jgi:tetratricopeptide (TPR) repeat protein